MQRPVGVLPLHSGRDGRRSGRRKPETERGEELPGYIGRDSKGVMADPFTIRIFVPDGDPEGVRLIDGNAPQEPGLTEAEKAEPAR